MKAKAIRKSQFTLIELLVVIAIIGILTGILLPAISSSMNEAKKTKAKADCIQIAMAVEKYKADYGSATSDWAVLAGGNARGKVYLESNFDNPWGSGQYDIELHPDAATGGSGAFVHTGTGETVTAAAAVTTTYEWGGVPGTVTSW